MGFTYQSGWKKPRQVVDYILQRKPLKHKYHRLEKGSYILWTLEDYNKNGELFIFCDLIELNGESYGYKSLCEVEHPYYYSVPKSWLKLAPVKCQEWRDEVLRRSAV